jgi:YYY domain-containing protein
MIDALRWLLVLEVVAVAVLPLSMWLLRGLPDRGFGLSKVAGLLFVTYLTWIAGSAFPIASGPLLPALAVLLLAALAWWFLRDQTLRSLQESLRPAIVEEVLFIAGFVAWCVMRAYVFHPAIAHTEQYMDMALLNASFHSVSYPPYDPWMSGHTVNYYYLGYLMCALPIKLSGVAPAVAYNLALSTLFAMTIAGAYSIGYALSRSLAWAAVSPLFVALVGNWHAVFAQLPHDALPGNTNWWFFDSSRVVAGQGDYTINEFPFFSFMLGDLHPHVMALPVTILAVGLGAAIVLRVSPLRGRPADVTGIRFRWPP